MSHAWTSDRDGVLSTNEDFSSTELTIGQHTITYVAEDDDGAPSDPATVVVNVLEIPNDAPTATILSISPSTALEGDTITFDGRGTDPDGTVTEYVWESDRDGVISNSEDFSTPALTVGTHVVSFMVRDNDGAWSDPVTETLLINEIPNQPPTAQILEIAPNPAPVDSVVQFDGSGIDSDGDVVQYDWESDRDGFLSAQEDFVTSTLSIGIHEISLRVRDEDGAWSNEVTRSLEIHPPANTQLTLVTPDDGSTFPPPEAQLEIRVDDPESDVVDLKFFGRRQGVSNTTTTGEEFTVIVLPDTQNYVRSGNWDHIFESQVDWILANREAENIVFVSHVGDVVFAADSTLEWDLADNILSELEGVLPYGIAPGNHDQNVHLDGTETLYPDYFPPSRFESYTWHGGSFPPGTNWNSYQLFSAGGLDFIFVHIQFCPTPEDISWANSVLQAHPNRFAVVTTHGYTDKFGKRGVNLCSDTEYIWTDLLVPNDNVYLLLCGHMREENLRSDFAGEREVHQVMANYQDLPKGGSGWLRILRFVPTEDRIDISTYSTWLDEYRTDSASQFSLSVPLRSFEEIGRVTDVESGSTVTIPWDQLDSSTTYEWFVTATDPNGGQVQSTLWTFTTSSGKPLATIVDVSPTPARAGFETSFDGSASDPGGAVTEYEWTSDVDGLLAQEEDFSTALSAGTHQIMFRARDNDGLWSDPATREIVVEETQPAAVIVDISPSPGQEGAEVRLEGTATDPDGTIVGYEWISNLDGLLSEEQTFVTTLMAPGLHEISFRARDDEGLWSESATAELLIEEVIVPSGPPGGFRRGDPNLDAGSDLSDGIYILGYLFADGETPLCLDAADTDDSGDVDISDSINLFSFLFLGGLPPPDPGPHDCGGDPTEDDLECEQYGACDTGIDP